MTPDHPQAVLSSDKPAKKRGRLSQERVMLFLILAFIGGVGLLVLFPHTGTPRDIAIGSYAILLSWSLFRLTR